EFVIILPETDINGAMVIAERLRKKIENHPFRLIASDLETPQEIHITVSIGVSQALPSSKITAQELIEQGDRAMYTAKKTGRNKVVSFNEIDTAVS
ncbi:MAG: diguanylate cyclase, partial [Phycisphaerae bacterium]|nr:diguanylate cyclase [Phycisphaerae bacterium]